MTPDLAQGIRDTLVDSIEREVPKTRRVLAAVPAGNRDYKPDDKSRSAWDLATHIATADVWFLDSIIDGKFEWGEGAGKTPAEMTSPETVATWYETHVPQRLAKVRSLTAEQLLRPVAFAGANQPDVMWLLLMNNHSIHHRGQLAAYLRAAGSKVPALFGVSADENAFG
jgi:uncharacterized damage-inducible protein DinB